MNRSNPASGTTAVANTLETSIFALWKKNNSVSPLVPQRVSIVALNEYSYILRPSGHTIFMISPVKNAIFLENGNSGIYLKYACATQVARSLMQSRSLRSVKQSISITSVRIYTFVFLLPQYYFCICSIWQINLFLLHIQTFGFNTHGNVISATNDHSLKILVQGDRGPHS